MDPWVRPRITAEPSPRVGSARPPSLFFALGRDRAPGRPDHRRARRATRRGGGPLVPLTFVAVGDRALLFFAAGYAAMAHRAPVRRRDVRLRHPRSRPPGRPRRGLGRAALLHRPSSSASTAWSAPPPRRCCGSWFGVTRRGGRRGRAAGCGRDRRHACGSTSLGGLFALLVVAEAAVLAGFAAANLISPGRRPDHARLDPARPPVRGRPAGARPAAGGRGAGLRRLRDHRRRTPRRRSARAGTRAGRRTAW